VRRRCAALSKKDRRRRRFGCALDAPACDWTAEDFRNMLAHNKEKQHALEMTKATLGGAGFAK
jgi:hypothetical protein